MHGCPAQKRYEDREKSNFVIFTVTTEYKFMKFNCSFVGTIIKILMFMSVLEVGL